MKPFAYILTTLVLSLAFSANAATQLGKDCGPRFGAFGSEPDATPQDPNLALIQKFDELRERISDAQGALNHDPFLWEIDPGGMMEIWNRLNRSFPGLDKIREEVWRAHRNEKPLPQWLIDETLAGVEKAIKSEKEDALHGARYALSRIQEILARDAQHPEDRKRQQEKEKEEKEKKDGKKDKKPKGPPQPPKYPETMKKYEPHNKTPPSEQEGGEAQEEASIARINVPGIAYFRNHVFSMLSKTNGWYMVPVAESPLTAHHNSGRYDLVASPLNKKNETAALMVPQGFVPLETKNAQGEVTQDQYGNWWFKTNQDNFKIPVIHQGDAQRPLSPHEMEVYTSPTGYTLSDWPVDLQGAVLKVREAYEKGQIKSLDAARILASHIGNKYLYAMEDNTAGRKNVSEIVGTGKFQCDVAATLLCSLLRDELKIPTRIVGGSRGSKDPFHPNYSHAIVPSEPHAWIEVADAAGNWHGFDATPIKKERESKNKGDADKKFQPIQSGDEKKQKDEKDKDGKDGKPGEKKDGKDSKDGKKGEKGQKGQKGQKGEKQEGGEAGDEQGEGEGGGKLEDLIRRKEKESEGGSAPETHETGKTVEELIKETKQVRQEMKKKEEEGEHGDEGGDSSEAGKGKGDKKSGDPHGTKGGKNDKSEKEAKPKYEKNDNDIPDDFMKKLGVDNPFIHRLVKRMIAWALDERLDGQGKMERLNRLYAAMGGQHPPQALVDAKKKLIEAAELFSGDYPATDVWLKNILKDVDKRPLNDTVDDLTHLHRQLQFTLQFMEEKEAASLRELSNDIARLRQKLASMKHPDAEKIRIVEELRKGLPGNITRGILDNDPGYLDKTHVGANLKTVALAKKITGGKDKVLQDFRMISALGPHTNFLVDPVFLPSGGMRNTVFRELRQKPTPKVLMPTTDPRDIRTGVYSLNPDIPLDQAMRQGQVVVLARRVQVKEPSGFHDVDPEKMTILAVDTSGSMTGEKAEFQADYVAALVDKALSDVNPNGKSRHRVYILPFDTTVKEPIEVNTAAQARELLMSRGRGIRNAGGGTEIQGVLVKAAKMIKKAQDDPNAKQLSRANVVLCSDGGASVDYATVKEEFVAGRGTNEELRIKFGFVAIGETNPDLVKFAKDSSQLGADTGTYIEWNMDMINNMQQGARQVPKPKNDFWTDQTYAQAPDDIKVGFTGLKTTVGRYSSALLARNANDVRTTPTLDWLALEADEKRPDRPDSRKKSHRGSLWTFREVLDAVGPVFTPNERAKLLDNTLKDWRSVVLEPMRSLDNNEIAQILHTLQWPSTGSANIVNGPDAPAPSK